MGQCAPSLGFIFLTCEMGLIMISSSQGCCEIQKGRQKKMCTGFTGFGKEFVFYSNMIGIKEGVLSM